MCEALGALLDNFNREQFAVGTGGNRSTTRFVKYRTSLYWAGLHQGGVV